MVIFDLICDSQHEFEGWFKSSDELVDQQKNGMLTCPVCDSGHVIKKLSIPKVGKKTNTSSLALNSPKNSEVPTPNMPEVDSALGSKEAYGQLQSMLKKVHDYVNTNFEDVGNKFSEQAISMHKGETEQANIRGTANAEQLKELAEEGVSALPLPAKPVAKKDLN